MYEARRVIDVPQKSRAELGQSPVRPPAKHPFSIYPIGKVSVHSISSGTSLKVFFKDKHVQELCQRNVVATRRLGHIAAQKLKARLFEMYTLPRVTDLRQGNPHPLKGDRAGQFAVGLAGGYRLVFCAAGEIDGRSFAPPVDWSAVTVICIEYIGDYHD